MAPYFLKNLVPHRKTQTHSRPLLTVVATITWVQWAMFFSGLLAWICAALNFFCVSLTLSSLEREFKKNSITITTSITLTLIFRFPGAVVFGILSDRYGRKWPLVCNLILVATIQLGAGFVQTFSQFLALRCLFGIGMGGIWGLAAVTALENLPVEVRGIVSGILQEGYATGHLLATIINLGLVPSKGWRALFWTGSGMSLFAAAVRAIIPESEVFLRAREVERLRGTDTTQKTKIFIHETKAMLKRHWLLCIYAALLMSGFHYLAHGSQQLYFYFLLKSKGFSQRNASLATIIGNVGAILGGVIAGWLSQYMGRRLTIILFVLLISAFIPLWIVPSSFGLLSAGVFCIQFFVQGAWGIIPIHLAEMSPPAFRATFPGVAYQFGSMIASPAAQFQTIGGNNLRKTIIKDGVPTEIPDFQAVLGIVVGVAAVLVVLFTIIGPEHHSSHFEKSKTAFQPGGGEIDPGTSEYGN